jgi:hypothetical protein
VKAAIIALLSKRGAPDWLFSMVEKTLTLRRHEEDIFIPAAGCRGEIIGHRGWWNYLV